MAELHTATAGLQLIQYLQQSPGNITDFDVLTGEIHGPARKHQDLFKIWKPWAAHFKWWEVSFTICHNTIKYNIYHTSIVRVYTVHWNPSTSLTWPSSLISNTVCGAVTIGSAELELSWECVKLWTLDRLQGHTVHTAWINYTLYRPYNCCTVAHLQGINSLIPCLGMYCIKYCRVFCMFPGNAAIGVGGGGGGGCSPPNQIFLSKFGQYPENF